MTTARFRDEIGLMRLLVLSTLLLVAARGVGCAANVMDGRAVQTLPDIVRDKIAAACDSGQKTEVSKGFVTRKDINGDGVRDVILDYDYFRCDGSLGYCGSGGCVRQVFASLPGDKFVEVFDTNAQSVAFKTIRGRHVMIVTYNYSSCGSNDPAVCVWTGYWDGTDFKVPKLK